MWDLQPYFLKVNWLLSLKTAYHLRKWEVEEKEILIAGTFRSLWEENRKLS